MIRCHGVIMPREPLRHSRQTINQPCAITHQTGTGNPALTVPWRVPTSTRSLRFVCLPQMSLARVPRTPLGRRCFIHHLSLTRTSSSPRLSTPNELLLLRAKSASHIQMAPLGASRNTLAGVSLVALGAGAFLYARAYSSSSNSHSSNQSRGTSSPAKSNGSRSISTSKDVGSETSAKQEAQQQTRAPAAAGPEAQPPAGSAAGGPKQPCGGCDCGLMEPGPLEGTMHAYERHVIICR